MPHGEDDPRQVLAALNSLGFVGITAEQLKMFMKDLKIHRKIKQRLREQWREETKKKIILKQRQALAELIEQNTNNNLNVNSTVIDSPTIKIKIKCISESDSNDDIENDEEYARVCCREKSESPRKGESKNKEIGLRTRSKNEGVKVLDKEKKKIMTNQPEMVESTTDEIVNVPKLSENIQRSHLRSKSVTSNPSSERNPSSSSRSQSKSFIRPWKLHPQIQRPPQNVKSDPVLLYQQYQKQWKKLSLPGENRHAKIRWAVREKMLGTDPTPRPILKKSCSSLNVKRG